MVSCSSNLGRCYTPADLSLDDLNDLSEMMWPGRVSNDGFIASDEDVSTVYKIDQTALESIGITHKQLGEILAHLSNKAIASPTNYVDIDHLHVSVDHNSDENVMSCPFSREQICHQGKRLFKVVNTITKQELNFSELTSYLIRDHGFFEGSVHYRVDPEAACSTLGLIKLDTVLSKLAEKMLGNFKGVYDLGMLRISTADNLNYKVSHKNQEFTFKMNGSSVEVDAIAASAILGLRTYSDLTSC